MARAWRCWTSIGAALLQQLSVMGDAGSRCLCVTGDGTAVVSAVFDRVEAELGPADILFNNVGQSARERGGHFIERGVLRRHPHARP